MGTDLLTHVTGARVVALIESMLVRELLLLEGNGVHGNELKDGM